MRRSIDTEHDIVELLEFVGAKMPEGYVSPYSDDCELQKKIAEKGGYCSKDCPFIGVVVPSNGDPVGTDCCPMFRIHKWKQGKRSSVSMTAIVNITQKVGEL